MNMTGMVMISNGGGCGGHGKDSSSTATSSRGGGGGGGVVGTEQSRRQQQQQQQLSLLEFLVAALRKSMVSCRVDRQEEAPISAALHPMEIGWPTNVQHVAHVTFDRFHGFLGLPLEFQVEIPSRVPSASVTVFGVSADSMQCSYDTRGNSVPTILLLMQERLYAQGGLKAEGIFRINPENSQEEHVRDQLNRGNVPDDIDVHCLAGLIKAWFRELPSGVLDGLSPEQVLQCNTEEDSVELVKQLNPTETALLNWAIDLMADVVEHEESNKMNARNVAMVFAPNMTQMSDPLTALMHAVQVMNLLKTLIMKTLREREETVTEGCSPMSSHSSDRPSGEEFESQQEDMETSCESTGPASDDDEPANYSHSSDEKDEIESLSDIEECFLRQLDENESAKNGFRKQLEGILCRDHGSPISCCTFGGDSYPFSSESKTGSSCLITDGEDSVALGLKAPDMNGMDADGGNTNDVERVELTAAPTPPVLLGVLTESI
ncbi:rho GTPase-activating protein 2 [Coffea arabica]|uniref:Rho GTPase-activating protein 2 n=1 Tax=Coffea arabica TaxID=13443 RepID=A0A6P6WSJ9_COFAR|nr:rho GTPase-activating protein 2-like [Coffea arabica]XP_027116512.1 rho GTPase-activating protein 2-like isoform X1 [Coffea arabica]